MGRKKGCKNSVSFAEESIIADLIADIPPREIAERTKCSYQHVYNTRFRHKERIESERAKLISEKQDEINAAFRRDIMRTVEAIEKTSVGILTAVDELIRQIGDEDASNAQRREACRELADHWEKLRNHVNRQRKNG